MERSAVGSSSLISVGYDSESKVLEVEFKSGRVYQYSEVPQNVADDLRDSESSGRFFYTNVRGKYNDHRVS